MAVEPKKRPAWLLLAGTALLLCIGAAINVLVAWSTQGKHQRAGPGNAPEVLPIPDWPRAAPSGWPERGESAWVLKGWSAERGFIMVFPKVSRTWNGQTLSIVVAGMDWVNEGLPFHCLTYCHANEVLSTPSYPHIDLINEPTLVLPLLGRVVPIKPLWPGFALNTIFYAAVAWGLWWGGWQIPLAIRRRRRRSKNQCTRCGYSLAGLASGAACPECGTSPKPA